MTFKGFVFTALAVVFVASVGLRVFVGDDASSSGATKVTDALKTSGSAGDGPGESFLPGLGGGNGASLPSTGSDDAGDGGGKLADALPYLTEGSFFAIIGFALGYASRKVVKLLLILLAGFFLLIQGLSDADVVQVDWPKAIDLVNDWILNLKENDTIGEVLKDKLPTAGALTAGYLLGFRKG
ncbi:MAG: FUN14 domain-containing protein [Planctomycetota bacterium JB042]